MSEISKIFLCAALACYLGAGVCAIVQNTIQATKWLQPVIVLLVIGNGFIVLALLFV